MRLTLRTLLAYLDDTLEPDLVKAIGQKVADSDTAQELIAQIKQVTRRRRLTTPPEEGPGSELEPNTIAEYLDNELSEDQVARVEQVCLRSDVHLAEVAATHQILTIVLGEPILIPPTSKDRMHKLVTGIESNSSRKATSERVQEHPPTPTAAKSDVDESLRMGVPQINRQTPTSQVLIVVGGAIAAVAILAFAIFQALQGPANPRTAEGTKDKDQQEQLENVNKTDPGENNKDQGKGKQENGTPNGGDPKGNNKGSPKDTTGNNIPGKTKKNTGKEPKTNPTKGKGTTTKGPGNGKTPPPEDKTPKLSVPPIGPVGVHVGNYVSSELGLLFQQGANQNWQLIAGGRNKVVSGMKLVSFPGFQSTVVVAPGLRLNLWGAIPEAPPHAGFLRESVVTLHKTERPLDLTIARGRVFIKCTQKGETPIRIRFQNPTEPLTEIWDVTLKATDPKTKTVSLLVEKWGQFSQEDRFYPDKSDIRRRGPESYVNLIVLKGKADVLAYDITAGKEPPQLTGKALAFSQKCPPGKALLFLCIDWGTIETYTRTEMPEGASEQPSPPSGLDKGDLMKYMQTQKAIAKAQATFRKELGGDLNVGLLNMVKSNSPRGVSVLAIRSYAAMDDVGSLVDELDKEEKNFPGVRKSAIETAKLWMAQGKNFEYQLYDALKQDYKESDAQLIMEYLHSYSAQDAIKPEIYQSLAAHLDHPKRVVRELAAYHLYYGLQVHFQDKGIDVAATVPYSVEAPPVKRQESQKKWMKLIADGKIPPTSSASGQ